MTKLNGSKPHKISVSTKIPNVAKFIKSAAQKFAEQSSWVDLTQLCQCSNGSISESLVKQINEDLNWLRIKLKKAQKYEPTAEIAAFERKLVRRIMELNQYAARYRVNVDHYYALTWSLAYFNVYADAEAIRSAKREWKKLERKLLNKESRGKSNRR